MTAKKGKKESAQEPPFEELLTRLEEIVESLEGGDATLDQGLALFEEGVGLSRRCQQMLEKAEGRIRKLVRDEESGGLTLDLFPGFEDEAE